MEASRNISIYPRGVRNLSHYIFQDKERVRETVPLMGISILTIDGKCFQFVVLRKDLEANDSSGKGRKRKA